MAGDAASNLSQAIADLAALQAGGGLDQEQERTVASSLKALEDVASLGECRMATPYSSMRPVRGADGSFKWCCNHDPEHCV